MTPSPKKAARGVVGVKVYPSVQFRTIVSTQQFLAEGQAQVDACKSGEGLMQANAAKVAGLSNKFEAKLVNEVFLHATTSANTHRNEDGQYEDLGALGKALMQGLQRRMKQLAVIAPIVASLHCTDEDQLEWSPYFLLRAIHDAQRRERAGFQVPMICYSMCVRRQCLLLLQEGKLEAAMCTLDPTVDMLCGMHLLKDNPSHADVQA